MRTLRRLWRLWCFYAWLDWQWVTRSFERFIFFFLCEAMINAAALSSTLLLAERFDGLGPWSKPQVIFMLGYAAMTTGLLEIFFGYNVLYIGRRLGRGHLDHTLIQPQPLWMTLLTEGFNPFGSSSGFLLGLGLVLWASQRLNLTLQAGWLVLCVGNLLASATVLIAVSFFWGSLAFFAPRAAEEINTPLWRLFDQLKLFPLDGLGGALRYGLLTVMPAGLVAWYPSRALLGLQPAWQAVWVTPLAALLCGLLALAMFRRGMQHYERTGSSRYRDLGHRG